MVNILYVAGSVYCTLICCIVMIVLIYIHPWIKWSNLHGLASPGHLDTMVTWTKAIYWPHHHDLSPQNDQAIPTTVWPLKAGCKRGTLSPKVWALFSDSHQSSHALQIPVWDYRVWACVGMYDIAPPHGILQRFAIVTRISFCASPLGSGSIISITRSRLTCA